MLALHIQIIWLLRLILWWASSLIEWLECQWNAACDGYLWVADSDERWSRIRLLGQVAWIVCFNISSRNKRITRKKLGVSKIIWLIPLSLRSLRLKLTLMLIDRIKKFLSHWILWFYNRYLSNTRKLCGGMEDEGGGWALLHTRLIRSLQKWSMI